jgi:hypothetical protein
VGLEHEQAQSVRGYSKRVLVEPDFGRRDAACTGDKRRLFLRSLDPNFGWFFASQPGMNGFPLKTPHKNFIYFTKKC